MVSLMIQILEIMAALMLLALFADSILSFGMWLLDKFGRKGNK